MRPAAFRLLGQGQFMVEAVEGLNALPVQIGQYLAVFGPDMDEDPRALPVRRNDDRSP
jgi:hypothetical protein